MLFVFLVGGGWFALTTMGSQFFCSQRSRGAFLVVFMLWGCLISFSCAARLSVSRQKLEVERHLKRVNKPPIKSFEVLALKLKLSLFVMPTVKKIQTFLSF